MAMNVKNNAIFPISFLAHSCKPLHKYMYYNIIFVIIFIPLCGGKDNKRFLKVKKKKKTKIFHFFFCYGEILSYLPMQTMRTYSVHWLKNNEICFV